MRGSYRRAADFLNSSNVDTVSVQHEFGIFADRPAATIGIARRIESAGMTDHAAHLLRTPNADQRRVMQALVAHSSRLVSWRNGAHDSERGVRSRRPAKIDLIPHGIPMCHSLPRIV